MVNERIARALYRLLHMKMELVFRLHLRNIKGSSISNRPIKLRGKLALTPVTTISKLRNHAVPIITGLGPSFYCDSVLLYKLLRLVPVILTEMNVDPINPPASGSENEQLYYDTITLVDASILLALSYVDCNCSVAEEI